jgi:hypothetical protein
LTRVRVFGRLEEGLDDDAAAEHRGVGIFNSTVVCTVVLALPADERT